MILFTKTISSLLDPKGYLAMSGDLEIFWVVKTDWGATNSILRVEARDATEYPLIHREELSSSKCNCEAEKPVLEQLSPSSFTFQKDKVSNAWHQCPSVRASVGIS